MIFFGTDAHGSGGIQKFDIFGIFSLFLTGQKTLLNKIKVKFDYLASF